MTDLMRERERVRDANLRFDGTKYSGRDLEDLERLREQQKRMKMDSSSPMDSMDEDVKTSTSDYTVPAWLKGLLPVVWTKADDCPRENGEIGQNCCLFYPLGYCRDTDVINGFCVFHLRAIFNLVYQTDCLYLMNSQNKPVMSQRAACYVAEPQIINDEYTPVFPLIEMFTDREIQYNDIKLSNLAKHFQMNGTQNWERIYTNHVNFLHRIFTLYSPRQMAQRPIETRLDHVTGTQLMMHFNLWNEYHSNLLTEYPSDISIFHVDSEKRDQVQYLPLNRCTTITQMIARLFSEPYTSLNDSRFFSTVASYGIYVQNHWAYANNLCSVGTHYTKGNLQCIGNLATLTLLRADTCRINTVHHSRMKCEPKLCVKAKINLDSPSLNQIVAVPTSSSFKRTV